MKIISWNINGINSLIKNGNFKEIFQQKPDILALQEIKSDTIPKIKGYKSIIYPSQKRGSGVAIYTKEEPLAIKKGLDIEKFDEEGRFLELEFPEFILINSYFPSGANKERLNHKFEYYQEVTKILKNSNKPIIICGDFNRISKEIDAKRPEMIINKPGFLKEEKEWFEDILSSGYIDAFRHFHKEGDNFTWWSYARNARELNRGYRFDYFLVSKKLIEMVSDSYILKDQLGSDHAPILLDLNVCQACGKLNPTTNEYCYNCGLKLIENDNEEVLIQEKEIIPKDKIILLDLNYTLISNSRESFGRYPSRIYRQKYEKELINLIKDNYVILITARPEKFKDETLKHIEDETGFTVEESYWNFGLQPPELKKYWMENEVFKKHGDNPEKYLAIESNPRTRKMYAKLAIEARPKQDFI